MEVLLLHPPDEMEAMLGEGKAFVQKYEPLGLLYVAAVARNAGFEVEVLDAYAEDLDEEAIKKRLVEAKPKILGISTLTCSGEIVYNLGRWLKKNLPETFVVLGNVHASIYAESYLRNGAADAVVHGEGEYPFLEICKAKLRGGELTKVPNTSFAAANGQALMNPHPALVRDLSLLPMPERQMLDQSRYSLDNISNQIYVGKARSTSKTMASSRGCYYKCTFCVVNQEARFNDYKLVVDEMEMLEKEYHAGYTLIVDPLCMYDRKRMFAICEEYIRRGLSIKWGCDARVNCITPDLLKAMEAAGCYDLSFGIESGVQEMLNNVKKGTKVPKITETVEMIKRESNILVGGLFILGLPGETYAQSLQTIAYAKSLPLDMAQFSILTPYPGSALFTELRAAGKLDTGERPDGGLDTSVWKRYSAYISFTDNDPIWVTDTQTFDQLKALQKRAQREFFLRPSMVLKHLKRVRPSNVLKMARIAAKAFV